MKKTHHFLVSVRLKENPMQATTGGEGYAGAVTEMDIAAHTRDAVRSWGGQYHPESPLFPTNLVVSVRPVQEVEGLLEKVKLLRKTLRLVLRVMPNNIKQLWLFRSQKEMKESSPENMKGQTLGTLIHDVVRRSV